MIARPSGPLLTNLQALRAVAAVGVVIFHFGLLPATALPFGVGAAGVDLFFVLSGFIIAHSAAHGTRHFLAHRLIRVLPAYWLVTCLASLFTLQSIGVAEAAGWLGQSLLYLPGPGGRPALIFVAWTLVYELAFYLLYWLALRFGPRPAPVVALGALVLLALVPLPHLPGPWPLLLEFALGTGIYLAVERHRLLHAVPALAGLAVSLAGLVLLVLLPRYTGYNPDDYQALGRVLTWGLPAGAIVLGLVVAEHAGRAVSNRIVLLLGAASYALYLLHPIVLGQLLQLTPGRPTLTWLICLLATAATVLLAIGVHLIVEAPLLRRLRRLLGDRRPVEQQATASP